MTAKEAVKFVKSKRGIVQPNTGFTRQLGIYAKRYANVSQPRREKHVYEKYQEAENRWWGFRKNTAAQSQGCRACRSTGGGQVTFPRFDRGYYWYLIVIFGKWQLTSWSLHDAHRAVVIILFTIRI